MPLSPTPLPPASKPPFNIPKGLSPLNNLRLKQTSLVEFYELNREDFFAVMTLRYFEIIDLPDPGAVADPKKGFDSFCDLMTQYLLAPPGETITTARDEKGRYVNFFGETILKHVGELKLTGQDLYAYDGAEKYVLIEKIVNVFVRYVAIECFNRALALQQNIEILKARTRIEQLQDGRRELKLSPSVRIL